MGCLHQTNIYLFSTVTVSMCDPLFHILAFGSAKQPYLPVNETLALTKPCEISGQVRNTKFRPSSAAAGAPTCVNRFCKCVSKSPARPTRAEGEGRPAKSGKMLRPWRYASPMNSDAVHGDLLPGSSTRVHLDIYSQGDHGSKSGAIL